jgi:hypothetical protein
MLPGELRKRLFDKIKEQVRQISAGSKSALQMSVSLATQDFRPISDDWDIEAALTVRARRKTEAQA